MRFYKFLSGVKPFSAKLNAVSSSPLSLTSDFMVTSHAGAMGTKPNTAESVKKLLESGADCIEVDLSFQPDGTPCIIHSKNPSCGNGEYLEKIFDILSDYKSCCINLDAKSYANLPEVDRLADAYGITGRAFYTGVGEKASEIVKNASLLPYYINCSVPRDKRNSADYLSDLAEKIISLGGIGINCQYKNITSDVCRIMHSRGLLVSAWTADCIIPQCRLLGMGVDNLTTKRPDKAQYCIESWGRF